MALKWPKIAQKAKKGIRKVQNGHETVKKRSKLPSEAAKNA